MHQLAEKLKAIELQKQIGNTCPVLWEQQINQQAGLWTGYTPQYHKIVTSDTAIHESKINSDLDNIN